MKELEVEFFELEKTFDSLAPQEIKDLPIYVSDQTYRLHADKYIWYYTRKEELMITIKILKKNINRLKHSIYLHTESNEVSVQSGGTISAMKMDNRENVTDVTGEQKDVVSIIQEDISVLNDNALSVYGFLRRPIQIAAQSLSLNSDIDLAFNVWNLFLGNPGVRAKLRNFAFMRCDLKVKVTISGTPFHYGKLLVSYQPFPAVNQNLVFAPGRRNARNRYLSQAYGARTIDVRENMPFELTIPYVSPLPVGRLYNDATTAIGTATVFNDFDDLGELYITTINQIKAVNTTATNVFIYVYVYADNVQLHGATGTVSTIQTESDEREVGPVERTTTALMPVSKALETVPIIGPFARASSIALGALNKVSAMFGWSYPVLIDKPMRMRHEAYQNGAQVIGVDTGKRITLDPKQELSVDPRIVGVNEDEMSISSLCKIESLLDTFNWAPGNLPLNTILWSAAVTPRASIVDVLGTAPNQYIATVPTTLGFCATPFHYWRGKIIYRFEIVASNFHRGKLMFYYEPNIRQNTLINSALNMNKQHVKIIDIQETQVVEFCVDWNFARNWCENLPDSNINTSVGAQFVNNAPKFETCNGVICVTPFTALQSPDGSTIAINVYVHSPDMAFNRMTSANYPVSIQPYTQSLEVYTESSEKWLSNKDSTCMDIAPSIMRTDNISMLHFGEQPTSFRSLLKRFQQGLSLVSSVLGSIYITYTGTIYPSNTYGDTIPAGGGFGSQQVRTLYNYVRFAYLAQRGGIRKRVRLIRHAANPDDLRINIDLLSDTSSTINASIVTGGTTSFPPVRMEGTVTFMSSVNNGYEFEVPFYSNNLFVWACNSDPFFSTNLSVIQVDNLRNYRFNIDGWINETITITESFATGEDFSFMRFLGSPPVRLNAIV